MDSVISTKAISSHNTEVRDKWNITENGRMRMGRQKNKDILVLEDLL